MPPESIADIVVQTLSRGGWSEDAIVRRMRRALRPHLKNTKWFRAFAQRLVESETPSRDLRDNPDEFARYVFSDPDFEREVGSAVYIDYELDVEKIVRPEMSPAAAAEAWDVPALTSSNELADWFALSISHLDWLADCRGLERFARKEKLRNYRYRWIAKHAGGRRLVESPKPRLKSVQRQILDGILAYIPVHSAAHAFRADRSVLTFAKPHVGQDIVLRIDLRDFFPSIPASRVHGIFRSAGYPRQICQQLTGLCTNRTWREATHNQLFAVSHLPQGAPTSPTLSNLCAWHLDCRLSGLAKKFRATYTRYADDMVFSGDRSFQKQMSRFRVLVYAIAIAEGFSIQNRKTRVMTKSQRQKVAGVVVNERTGVSRLDFDRLKAILTNCIRHGPDSQNRDDHPHFEDHLRGRVAWVSSLNQKQGDKLRGLFEQIAWGQALGR